MDGQGQSDVIESCKCYGGTLFDFATGPDGESILVSIGDDERIHVHYRDSDSVPEPIDVYFSDVLRQTLDLADSSQA